MQQYPVNLSGKVSKQDMLHLDDNTIDIKQRRVGETLPSITKESKKKKKNRCCHDGCNKKLSLVDKTMGECKCNNLYCQIHRDSSKHACTFDWHNTKKAELAVQLHSNKCVGSKITAI